MRFSGGKMAAAWKNIKQHAMKVVLWAYAMACNSTTYCRCFRQSAEVFTNRAERVCNINIACKKHFASRIGHDVLCYVFAGEGGGGASSIVLFVGPNIRYESSLFWVYRRSRCSQVNNCGLIWPDLKKLRYCVGGEYNKIIWFHHYVKT